MLEDAYLALGLSPSNTGRLSALPYIAKRKLTNYPRVLASVLRFCGDYSALSEEDDVKLLAEISNASPKIDGGEARLFAAGVRRESAVVFTGDKRSVIAIATEPKLKLIAQKLEGRIEILETTVLRLVDLKGFEFVRGRVLRAPRVDGMLKLAFDTQEPNPEAHCRDALTSVESQIESLHSGLIRRV